ncbi:MAG: hypothetical protein LBP56_09010 [Odoribacteraceae bacterium]|jgi:hypothetical protein|nr:hypothetical protein [Odoribacteraceae bacterium]
MNLKEKYISIQSVFMDRLGGYLEKYGYEFSEKEIEDDELKSLQLVFINNKINRSLTISYLPFNIRGETSERVIVFIARTNVNGVYSLKDIFNHDNISFDSDRFCLLNYAGSFEEQLEQACKYYIALFDDYLQEWIKGEKWEDIPFDWDPYK